MVHREAERPHIATNSVQGCHPGRSGKGIGFEGDMNLLEEGRCHAKAAFMGCQAQGCLVFLGHEGEQAIAGKIGPPESVKGGRMHYRQIAFRFPLVMVWVSPWFLRTNSMWRSGVYSMDI